LLIPVKMNAIPVEAERHSGRKVNTHRSGATLACERRGHFFLMAAVFGARLLASKFQRAIGLLRLSRGLVLTSLDKAAQSFVGDIHPAMFVQNSLNPPVTTALPPPAKNVIAERFELGARFGERQVLQAFQQFFARVLVCHVSFLQGVKHSF